jgi:23S rRNA pseudouridine1911/1915/1917 synthase
MLNIIKNYIKEKYNKPGNVYLGLVHRLDRPVSGVMVFAKTSKAASRLSKEIKENKMHKTYLAIVHGKLKENKKRLVNKISKDYKTNSSYIDNKNGKEAILEYEVLKYDSKSDLSVLKINLITGRHHQIRLQLSNIKHPIYGDQRYGMQDKKQIALYAYKLEFIHPVLKEKMTFSYLPDLNIIEDVKEML